MIRTTVCYVLNLSFVQLQTQYFFLGHCAHVTVSSISCAILSWQSLHFVSFDLNGRAKIREKYDFATYSFALWTGSSILLCLIFVFVHYTLLPLLHGNSGTFAYLHSRLYGITGQVLLESILSKMTIGMQQHIQWTDNIEIVDKDKVEWPMNSDEDEPIGSLHHQLAK